MSRKAFTRWLNRQREHGRITSENSHWIKWQYCEHFNGQHRLKRRKSMDRTYHYWQCICGSTQRETK